MIFFITNAFADGAAAQPGGGLMSFLPMIAFIAILYFLLIRPQQKKQKQHMALVASVKKGDKVVTNSGIIATVSKVLNEQEVVLEIADGVYCKFVKSTINSVFTKEAELIAANPVKEDSTVQEKKSAKKDAEDQTADK